MFGQEYQMKIDGGDDQLKTGLGTICSVILLIITAVYAYQKLLIMLHRKDTNILSASKDLFFTDEDNFSYE